MFDTKKVAIEWGGKTLTLETGKVARQADGAVIATLGETVVLCAVIFGGGSAVGGVVTVVGVAVLASSYVWGISQAKDWLSVSSNRKGNLFTVLGRASDALSNDMSKSPSNFLRDTVAAGTVIALAPLSAILLIL